MLKINPIKARPPFQNFFSIPIASTTRPFRTMASLELAQPHANIKQSQHRVPSKLISTMYVLISCLPPSMADDKLVGAVIMTLPIH